MVLQAYVDESGTDERSTALVFAGYVVTIEQCDHFGKGWITTLAEPSSIRYAKFTEAMGLKGQFHRWTEKQRNEKLALLSKFARRHSLFSFSVVVPKMDFEQASAAIHAPKKNWNPWILSFSGVMKAVHEYQKIAGIQEEMEFVFDRYDKYAEHISNAWAEFSENCEPGVRAILGNPPQFKDDKKVVALQAADLLAGSIRAQWHERLSGESGPDLSWIGERVNDPDMNDPNIHHHFEFVIRENDWIQYFQKTLADRMFNDTMTLVDLSQTFGVIHVEISQFLECDPKESPYLDVCGLQTEYVSRRL